MNPGPIRPSIQLPHPTSHNADLHTLKRCISAFLNHWLLPEAAVMITFFSYSFHPGTIGDLMRICGGIVLANLIARNYRLSFPSSLPIFLILGFSIILVINFFAPAKNIHHRSFRYFLAFPGMALAVYYLIVKKEEADSRFSPYLYGSLFIGAVVFQVLVISFVQDREMLGIYGNLHRLGMFSCITIPAIAYLGLIATNNWWRLLLFAAGILDFILLFSSNSRVSWVALPAGSLLTILIFFRGWNKILAILSLVLSSLLAGLFFGLSRIVDSASFFLTHVMEEDRWTIWSDTLKLLGDNTTLEWFFGHGIGSFRYYFQDYSTSLVYGKKFQTSFPHNGFLQILFENGMIGFLVIFGGLAALMIAFVKSYRSFKSRQTKFFMITMFAVAWIDFGCFIFNEPYYSKYIQYSFSVIVGIMMALISKAKQIDAHEAANEFRTFNPDKADINSTSEIRDPTVS